MNTILLQKILDLLKDNLTGVGTFIKSVFVHDPQDNQILSYDSEIGKWVNKDATEVELNLTNTFEAQPIATITDGAENVPMKSLVCEIVPKETGTGTKSPSNPYVISGTDEVVITHNYGDTETDTYTKTLPRTICGGEFDVVSGSGTETQAILELDGSSDEYWSTYISQNGFYLQIPDMKTLNGEPDYHCNYLKVTSTWTDALGIRYGANNKFIYCLHITDNITGVTDVETWRTYLSNNHLVITYPLATPAPITTTPTQIKTQGGTENIFADCGDVSGEYYTKTAKSVLALANITEDITASVTKNTTDFSDILFKASKNNKVVSIEIYSASTSSALIGTFLSNLPKPAMNCKVLLANTTLGEDGIILGALKTTGELEITTTGAKTFSGIITYVEK